MWDLGEEERRRGEPFLGDRDRDRFSDRGELRQRAAVSSALRHTIAVDHAAHLRLPREYIYICTQSLTRQ